MRDNNSSFKNKSNVQQSVDSKLDQEDAIALEEFMQSTYNPNDLKPVPSAMSKGSMMDECEDEYNVIPVQTISSSKKVSFSKKTDKPYQKKSSQKISKPTPQENKKIARAMRDSNPPPADYEQPKVVNTSIPSIDASQLSNEPKNINMQVVEDVN